MMKRGISLGSVPKPDQVPVLEDGDERQPRRQERTRGGWSLVDVPPIQLRVADGTVRRIHPSVWTRGDIVTAADTNDAMRSNELLLREGVSAQRQG